MLFREKESMTVIATLEDAGECGVGQKEEGEAIAFVSRMITCDGMCVWSLRLRLLYSYY